METRQEQINELLKQLYIKKYNERISILCTMDSIAFKNYILRDWRFESIYLSYIAKTNDNTSIEDFYNQKLDTLYKFIFDCVLDMPDELKPKQIYLDEQYPFVFEVIKYFAPDFEQFAIDMNARHLRKIGKYFNKLNAAEMQDRFIDDLKSKIKIIEQQEELERENNKVKIILKYDKQGQLVNRYYSRQECMDDNGLTKQGLSQHLLGKRKSLKGYIYKEVIHYH